MQDLLPRLLNDHGTEVVIVGALLVYLLMNAVTYSLFASDKQYAIDKRRRVSERALLWFALLGGSLGAKLAQKRLRHKTRKQPFAAILNQICVVHIIVAGVLISPIGPQVTGFAGEMVASLKPAETEPKPSKPRRFGPGS
ncbi:DUF1294 domain-containing protein [Shimia sp.]|uniref:DUF1294 domain-containing protein n=1 Tax=Shimia sp. TaxID=1954381 RepID=UPI003297412A